MHRMAIDWTHRRGRSRLTTAITLVLPLLAACAGARNTQPREVLDDSSGSTLFVVQQPLLFARSRSDLAANARDYVTLVALQEDRSGKYSSWLIAHRWSTVDPRMGGQSASVTAPLRIIADDRELIFKPATPPPTLLQNRELIFAPRGAGAQSAAYAVDVPTLRYLATASRLALRYGDDALSPAYSLWDDSRSALQELLSGATGVSGR